MGGDETSLSISCDVALHISCWSSIVPASCWNSAASDSPIWTSVYFRVVAKTVESSRTKIHRNLCTAVRGSRRTTALQRYIDCGAFDVTWFVRIERRKLWVTYRWMSLSKRTALWSSLSRREQEEASSTSAAKSRRWSSMQRNFRVFKMQVLWVFAESKKQRKWYKGSMVLFWLWILSAM